MWSRGDLEWLSGVQPGLRPVDRNTLAGSVMFAMIHRQGSHILDPGEDDVLLAVAGDGVYICDTYQIRLAWPEGSEFPKAYEEQGRIQATAQGQGLNPRDLHVSPDDSLCLATGAEMKRTFQAGFSLKTYMNELLIPYLFAESHYAGTGDWLWGELSHGHLGILEELGR